MNNEIISAIVAAAEKEGGISKLSMCGGKSQWRECLASGMFWYNDIENSTKVIMI